MYVADQQDFPPGEAGHPDNPWGDFSRYQQQPIETQSMLHTVAVTQNAVITATGIVIQPEKLIAGPEVVMSRGQFEAVAVFAAKNATALKDLDGNQLTVAVKQGI